MWNLPTTRGTVLYLCLEDNYHRIPNRLLRITDDVPPNIFFAITAKTLADGLKKLFDQTLRRDLTDDPNCKFVVFVGTKRLIKRRLFEQYIDQVYSL